VKYAIRDGKDLGKLPKDATAIHLVRPLPYKDLKKVLGKGKWENVTMSNSCWKRLPQKTKNLFKEKSIPTKIESKPGRAIGIGLQRMLEVIEMRKDFQPFRDIEETTSIPKSTVHYLIKYAHRDKIKKGKDTIYLK